MKQYVNTPRRRFMAFLLAVTILIQCGAFTPFPVKAATSAHASGRLTIGDAAIDYQQYLQENGDGTYSLTLTLASPFSRHEENTNVLLSNNGYFTAPITGDYVIELWGGKGADGGSEGDSKAGDGGAAGYIYGIVRLEKGQTLFYQLGGNGQSSRVHGVGGGANGPGGHAGSDVVGSVGGGGGYSAVFLFTAGEFEAKYLNDAGEFVAGNISEEDRKSKHLMIAGGGGGGGNSSAGSLITDAGNKPSGGAGGSFASVLIGQTADGGTYFAGGDGKTSGNQTTRIGLGGAIEPGEVRKALLSSWGLGNIFGVQPNNWAATVDTGAPGGMGGDGNLRGGGGGAGYAGGSGGLQTDSFANINVGGGGGGSSYISSAVTLLTDAQKDQYLTGNNSSETGGSIRITAITQTSTTSLSDISLDFTISKYFDITACYLGEVELEALEDGTYPLDGINVAAGDKTISWILKPKSGFAGGNGVPLLDGNLSFEAGDATASMALHSNCARVNVPLNFTAQPINLMTNAANHEFAVTELYRDNVSGLDLTSWEYDFIASVSPYKVYDAEHAEIKTATITPAVTSRYYVGYTVTPKSSTVAVVGNVVKTKDIQATAMITIVSGGSRDFNNNTIRYNKLLSYDQEKDEYVLSFVANIEPNLPTVDEVNADLWDTTDGKSKYEITYTGYYLVQVWGADGGKGGKRDDSTLGGDGGAGAYLEYYVKLSAGDTLNVVAGTAGASGSDKSSSGTAGPGQPGGSTFVTYVPQEGPAQLLMIAGGGGGGGAAWRNLFNGKTAFAGQSGYDPDKDSKQIATSTTEVESKRGSVDRSEFPWYTTSIHKISSLSGDTVDAQKGNAQLAAQGNGGTASKGNSGGNAGYSYWNDSLLNKGLSETPDFSAYSTADKPSGAGTNGAAKITCLKLEEGSSSGANMTNYTFRTELSKYFTYQSMSLTDNKQSGGVLTYTTETHANNQIVVTGISPNATTGSVSFTITIRFKAHEDFAGGNNVPALWISNSSGLNLATGMRLEQPTSTDPNAGFDIESQAVTDYANVPIKVSALGTLSAKPKESREIHQENVDSAGKIIGVPYTNLYTWTQPAISDADAWRYDYVVPQETIVQTNTGVVVEDTSNIVPSPLVTTVYTVSVGYAPKYEATATVVSPVSPVTISLDVEIIVIPRIQYELTNLNTSASLVEVELPGQNPKYYHTIKDSSQDHVAVLTPVTGHVLPASVAAYATDGTPIPVLYNASTGQLTIESEYLIGTVRLVAVADVKTYDFTVHLQNAPGVSEYTILDQYTASYPAGKVIDIEAVLEDLQTLEDPTGYDFVWELYGYGTNPDTWPTVMPSGNLRLYGRYVPETYQVTIEYHWGEVVETEIIDVAYGQTYVFQAKTYDNYVVSGASLNGTQQSTTQSVTLSPTGDAVIIFTYKSTVGALHIIYQYPDGSQAAPSYEMENANIGQSYTVTSPVNAGYTPYIVSGDEKTAADSVTVTVPDAGITVYVTYLPNTYQVTLNPNGGAVGLGALYVEYNNQYNYYSTSADGEKSVHALPTPVWQYHTFQGWYIDADDDGIRDAGEEMITGESLVNIAGNIVLTAAWTADQGKVIIVFVDEADNKLRADEVIEGDIGAEGEFDLSPWLSITVSGEKFTTEPENVLLDFTFTEETQLIKVVYISENKTYRLTINYWNAENQPLRGSYIEDLKKGETYTVSSPEIEGYELVNSAQATISGTMGTENITITVYYKLKEVVDVIAVTVSWGDLSFDYSYGTWNPETHQYDRPSVDPRVEGSNYVQVTSGSTIPVDVALSYENTASHNTLEGYYTTTSNRYGTHITQQTLAVGSSQTFYFWLRGEMDFSWQGNANVPVGTCKVSIVTPSTP